MRIFDAGARARDDGRDRWRARVGEERERVVCCVDPTQAPLCKKLLSLPRRIQLQNGNWL